MRFVCLVDSGRRGVQVGFGFVLGLDVVMGDGEEGGRRGEDAQFSGRM